MAEGALPGPAKTDSMASMLMTFFREEHEMFRKSVEQSLAKEIAPHVEEW